MKSQSAMEFLMTYGWAILIIAILLAALNSLGFFNPLAYATKAAPGSCTISRPNGPNTTFDIQLVGTCDNFLPQYVPEFGGQQYNSYLQINNASIIGANSITVTIWFKATAIATTNPPGYMKVFDMGQCTICGIGLEQWYNVPATHPPNNQFEEWVTWNLCSYSYSFNGIVPAGQWVFASISTNGQSSWGGFNGSYSLLAPRAPGKPGSGCTAAAPPAGAGADRFNAHKYPYNGIRIGDNQINGQEPFYGAISNLQIYNNVLSANQIKALYLEGLGGDPISTQTLIGWWPLNGNINDYSGNSNGNSLEKGALKKKKKN